MLEGTHTLYSCGHANLRFALSSLLTRWTEEQEKELLRLHQLHGDRWALIGKTLEISAEAVRSKYRLLKKEKGVSVFHHLCYRLGALHLHRSLDAR